MPDPTGRARPWRRRDVRCRRRWDSEASPAARRLHPTYVMHSMAAGRLLLLVPLAVAGCAAEKANGRPWGHKVRIEGVKHVDKKELKSKIALEETSWIPLSPKKYLDPFAVDIDRKRIEAYYAAHGYFNATVKEATVQPRDSKNESVDVKLVVDEGPPTKISA